MLNRRWDKNLIKRFSITFSFWSFRWNKQYYSFGTTFHVMIIGLKWYDWQQRPEVWYKSVIAFNVIIIILWCELRSYSASTQWDSGFLTIFGLICEEKVNQTIMKNDIRSEWKEMLSILDYMICPYVWATDVFLCP